MPSSSHDKSRKVRNRMPSSSCDKSRLRLATIRLPIEKVKKDKVKRGKMKRAEPSVPNEQTVQDGLSPNPILSILIHKGMGMGAMGLEELTSNPVLPQQRTRLEENHKPSKWIQFGPIYADDSEINQRAKDSAWEHISGKDSITENNYLLSITNIQKDAMDCYERSIAEKQKRAPYNFRWMMVKDGCFFLQLTLHILGAGHELLGYPLQHLYFGGQSDSSSWIPAMFYAGNQIPYVVIQALMEQEYFQDVLRRKGKWQRPSEDDLEKLVLYKMVVKPQLAEPPSNILHALHNSLLVFYQACRLELSNTEAEPPSNILHALHNLLLGSGDTICSETKEFQDLETGVYCKKTKIPSAAELYKRGIRLRKAERSGISNIKFKNCGFAAYLYLPPLTIDTHTKDLLTSLVKFEQGVNSSDREITSYIRFMRDLTPTYKDFKILKEKGIIQVKDDDLKNTAVRMLDKIVSLNRSSFTFNFLQIRHRIEDYGGPPWRLISILLGILTTIQTIFTILAYFFPLS